VNGVAEELERVADLCVKLDLAVPEGDLKSRVLEPIAAAVGAEKVVEPKEPRTTA
jgi:hypothetical protein